MCVLKLGAIVGTMFNRAILRVSPQFCSTCCLYLVSFDPVFTFFVVVVVMICVAPFNCVRVYVPMFVFHFTATTGVLLLQASFCFGDKEFSDAVGHLLARRVLLRVDEKGETLRFQVSPPLRFKRP